MRSSSTFPFGSNMATASENSGDGNTSPSASSGVIEPPKDVELVGDISKKMKTTLGEVFKEKSEFASPCGVGSAKPWLPRGVGPAAPPLIDESSTLKVIRPHLSSCTLALSGCTPSRFYTCKGEFSTDFKNVNRPD